MRTERDIKGMFNSLVSQRDRCDAGSAARDTLNNRAFALAWVLEFCQTESLLLVWGEESLRKCDIQGEDN